MIRRVTIAGGEAELAQLLDLHPEGVEELDGAYAVYTDEAGERALRARFETVSEDVPDGWEDAWRAFHHGVVVGRFWVGPPWEEAPGGVEAIVIDPGRAFGTGAHATTRLSLELLQELEAGSVLDVGCGSGVLSIAAAKLGYAPVIGVDVEEAAVEATLANAAANDVEVSALHLDALAEELPRTEAVVANVALDVVERLGSRLGARRFVASGYLASDEPELPGWHRIGRRTRDGWAADLFVR